jgi:hypothetical protein
MDIRQVIPHKISLGGIVVVYVAFLFVICYRISWVLIIVPILPRREPDTHFTSMRGVLYSASVTIINQ